MQLLQSIWASRTTVGYHYLTYSHALDGDETYDALIDLGANIAAAEFRIVLDKLGEPLKATSQEAR